MTLNVADFIARYNKRKKTKTTQQSLRDTFKMPRVHRSEMDPFLVRQHNLLIHLFVFLCERKCIVEIQLARKFLSGKSERDNDLFTSGMCQRHCLGAKSRQ